MPPPEKAGRQPAEERKQKMATTRSSGTADQVNARLLELLEQLVTNQAVQATADLNQEIADRFGAALRHRQDHDRANAGLSQEQLQLVLHFRAVRNAQGNLARHADQSIVLMPPPTLDDGTLEFVEALPHQAETLRLFGPDGSQTGRRDRIGGAKTVKNVGDVASVQIDDAKGSPILLGFPRPASFGAQE